MKWSTCYEGNSLVILDLCWSRPAEGYWGFWELGLCVLYLFLSSGGNSVSSVQTRNSQMESWLWGPGSVQSEAGSETFEASLNQFDLSSVPPGSGPSLLWRFEWRHKDRVFQSFFLDDSSLLCDLREAWWPVHVLSPSDPSPNVRLSLSPSLSPSLHGCTIPLSNLVTTCFRRTISTNSRIHLWRTWSALRSADFVLGEVFKNRVSLSLHWHHEQNILEVPELKLSQIQTSKHFISYYETHSIFIVR